MNILTKISVVLVVVLGLFMGVVLINVATLIPNYKVAWTNEQNKNEQSNTLAMNTMLALRSADPVGRREQEAGDPHARGRRRPGRPGQDHPGPGERQGETGRSDRRLQGCPGHPRRQPDGGPGRIHGQGQDHRRLCHAAEGPGRGEPAAQQGRRRAALRHRAPGAGHPRQRRDDPGLQGAGSRRRNQPATGKPVATGTEEGQKIDGQITAASGNTASVNIGSAKGIKKGMRLIVYRDNRNTVQILGYLQISDVDLSESGGVIVDRQGDVKPGRLRHHQREVKDLNMTQTQPQGPVVPVKPQPNIYTVLLIIAVIGMAVAVGISLNDLMHNYGMTLGDLFDPKYNPLSKP